MKWKLFLYFFGVFAAFTAIVVTYQQHTERDYRQQALRSKMDLYSAVAARNPADSTLPSTLRVTIIDRSGGVLFDNTSKGAMENHLVRPEIEFASRHGAGWDVRRSATTSTKYYYYARLFGGDYVRVAVPYIEVERTALEADKGFLWIVTGLFLVSLIFLWFIARNFGSGVERLKQKIVKEQSERSKLKTEMTSAIAHELRTPVSAIRAYTETLLSSDMPADKSRQFIERTAAASMRLSELLSDVSILTKIEEASHLFNKENVDISALVAEVLDEHHAILTEHSITVVNNLPSGVEVNGSRTLLYSIFRNLIENAVYHGGNWIELHIDLMQNDAQSLKFAVADTGRGVDSPAHLERIFERFYRIEQGRVRNNDDNIGSGLGLSIVRHAVEFHGGHIQAISNPNAGMRFEFTIKKDF